MFIAFPGHDWTIGAQHEKRFLFLKIHAILNNKIITILYQKRGVIYMPQGELVTKVKTIHQSYLVQAEKHPVDVIDHEAANSFNNLLDESKRIYPENQWINKMQPVTPNQTQFAGLVAKLVILEDFLRTEKSA